MPRIPSHPRGVARYVTRRRAGSGGRSCCETGRHSRRPKPQWSRLTGRRSLVVDRNGLSTRGTAEQAFKHRARNAGVFRLVRGEVPCALFFLHRGHGLAEARRSARPRIRGQGNAASLGGENALRECERLFATPKLTTRSSPRRRGSITTNVNGSYTSLATSAQPLPNDTAYGSPPARGRQVERRSRGRQTERPPFLRPAGGL
jgi:hypothetical protein